MQDFDFVELVVGDSLIEVSLAELHDDAKVFVEAQSYHFYYVLVLQNLHYFDFPQ